MIPARVGLRTYATRHVVDLLQQGPWQPNLGNIPCMARTAEEAADFASSREGEAASKAAMTRQRILDAAARVLSNKGYGGLRMNEVAREAELQTPAIYYYFPSRDELIEEVMWAGIANTREHMAAVLDELTDDISALDRLLAAVAAHVRHALQISDYTTASIRNVGQVPERIRQHQILEEERYGEIWRRLINDVAHEGSLRADLDLYIAQMLVLGALNWTVEWWDPRRGSIESVVANAQSIVRHGLSAASRRFPMQDVADPISPPT